MCCAVIRDARSVGGNGFSIYDTSVSIYHTHNIDQTVSECNCQLKGKVFIPPHALAFWTRDFSFALFVTVDVELIVIVNLMNEEREEMLKWNTVYCRQKNRS